MTAQEEGVQGGTAPRIESESWGRLEVEGESGSFKDAKLFPGGAREWDWGETGTEHVPGIQPDDARELLEHGAEVVVLSRGRMRALKVPKETVGWLEKQGVEVLVLPTGDAIRRYNELADQGKPVGALIHSTC
ncbi:MAG: Mth938-like domain-containing protein [Thermoanaerobaculia bacterium]|nr:Mth938-like domain-containing protein [Thermoanaerobaculia bacterium]